MNAIRYKTKVRQWANDGGAYIEFKRRLSRADCDLKPHQHAYYNSDLFPAMLNGFYRKVIGGTRERADLNALPAGVTLDTSGFLATLTIELPQEFK